LRGFVSASIALALLLSLLAYTGASRNGGDPLGMLGLYVEYECPPLTYNLKYATDSKLDFSDAPNAVLLAKYYNSPFYKSIVDRWGDDIARVFRNRFAARDPLNVYLYLSEYNYRVLLKGMDYRFHYNFSFHVVGYDGEFYDVILRLKVSIVSLKNFSNKLYEFPVIEERVKVSARDRSVLYRGNYAGIWPLFLLPHELYEGSRVKLSDKILFKLFDVTDPIGGSVEGELKAEVVPKDNEFLKRYWEDLSRYFKEVVGITIRPESSLRASSIDYISDSELVDKVVWALFNVTVKYYQHLGFSPPPDTPGKWNMVSLSYSFKYDVNSGVAYVFHYASEIAPDIFTYVIPLTDVSHMFGGSSCNYFIMTRIAKKPYMETDTTTPTQTESTATTEATGAVTATATTTTPTSATETGSLQTQVSQGEVTAATREGYTVTGGVATGRVTTQALPTRVASPTTRPPVATQEVQAPSGGLTNLELAVLAVIVVFVATISILLVRRLRSGA